MSSLNFTGPDRYQGGAVAFRTNVFSECFCQRYSGTAQAGYTFGSVIAAPYGFDAFRVGHVNGSGTAYNVTKTVAALTAQLNQVGSYAPVDALGGVQPWTAVTYGGAAGGSVPLATNGAGDDANGVPGYLWSDWMDLSSIPRLDGSERHYLHLRTTRDAGWQLKADTLSDFWSDPTLNLGREVFQYYRAGDFTASPGIGSTAAPGAGYLEHAVVQFMCRRTGYTFQLDGDSLSQGLRTRGQVNGWAHQAVSALWTPNCPTSLVMGARSGASTASMFDRGTILSPILKAPIEVFPVYSPNDTTTPTRASMDTAWRRAMKRVRQVTEDRRVPVLIGPIPWTWNVAYGALVKEYADRLTAMRREGRLLVLDFWNTISDGAVPARMKADYLFEAGDGHPNDAGHAAMARVAIPVFARAMAAA